MSTTWPKVRKRIAATPGKTQQKQGSIELYNVIVSRFYEIIFTLFCERFTFKRETITLFRDNFQVKVRPRQLELIENEAAIGQRFEGLLGF